MTELRTLLSDLQKLESILSEKIANKNEIMERLQWIFNDDEDLARTVYDYVMLGHKSYYNQLRTKFRAIL
jgi:hypothetical protein